VRAMALSIFESGASPTRGIVPRLAGTRSTFDDGALRHSGCLLPSCGKPGSGRQATLRRHTRRANSEAVRVLKVTKILRIIYSRPSISPNRPYQRSGFPARELNRL